MAILRWTGRIRHLRVLPCQTMSRPLVSVILVNVNGAELVDLVFPCLLRQNYESLEVLVMDNGSTDDSCERIGRAYPRANVIRLGANTGFSHALNAGIRMARGDYILSLNLDVTLDAGFVSALVDVLERRLDVGWVAGALRQLRPGAPATAIDCTGHYWLPSRYCYGYDPAHPELGFYDSEREVFGASACAALYRRSMLEAIAIDGEIFDEDLFAYFEDVDLDWRAQQKGYRCLFTPLASGAHMRGGTGLNRRPEVAALLLSNRVLVMIKNDEWRDLVRDASPILRRTVRDLASHLRRQPSSIWIAAGRVLRLAPRMWRKRRRIKQDRTAPVEYITSLRLKTDFLG